MVTTVETACGGCAGAAAEAPRLVDNRPGLSAIDARIADWAGLRRTQLALLSSSALGKLSELRTRETDDFSIALIDAWAVAGDVLTYYSERLAIEALLETAAEPLSLREMARLVGYRPRPGVAASAALAFTLSDAPGSPQQVAIAAGAKVMSTPGQDERPVTYETASAIVGRPVWNGIRPQLVQPHPLAATTTTLLFSGLATGLTPGDAVLFTGGGEKVFALVRRVVPRAAAKAVDPASQDITEVLIERVGGAPLAQPAAAAVSAVAVELPPAAQQLFGQTLSAADIAKILAGQHLEEEALFGPYRTLAAPPVSVEVFRKRASSFGHNAPALNTLPEALIGQIVTYTVDAGVVKASGVKNGAFFGKTQSQWPDTGVLTLLAEASKNLYLDAPYDGARVGSHVVIRDGTSWALYSVTAATELTKTDFTISAKVTRLTLDSDTGLDSFGIRKAAIYLDSEVLPLAPVPLTAPVQGGSATPIALDGWYPGLQPGQRVMVTGRVPGGGIEPESELRTLAAVTHSFVPGDGTQVALSPALSRSYVRRSVRITANVVEATHGESVFEVLGSGDSRVPFQSFRTQQAPQTHLTAPVAGGAAPTLEVRVNDVLWTEVPSLLDRGADERIYVTRIDEEGRTVVTFGDGVNGTRLPTGADNVRCRYRKGLGLAGGVRAHQLNQPMTRPLGLTGADNPLPASGGADPESMATIRESAPLTVRTLDRTVSLLDYEDYARAYAGVAKALAVPMWDGTAELVFVTVAAEGGATIADPSPIRTALAGAVAAAGDPYARFAVGSFVPVPFRMGAAVKLDPAYLLERVLPAVEARLRERFGFAARRFGQPVAASEVLSAIHSVPGVVAARMTALHRDGAGGNAPRLAAEPPLRLPTGTLRGAELLMLDAGPLDTLTVMP